MPHYAIIANGNFLVEEILKEAVKGKIIIALDGAADKLARIGLKPQLILGDFDSISESMAAFWGIKKTFAELEATEEAYAGNHEVLIVPTKNQELTDLDKAIQYCDQHEAASITLLCATGGRLDHHEGVMMSLRSQYKKGRPIFLHTEQQTLFYAKDETLILRGEAGDKCGIIATHTGKVSSKGLAYECKDHSESVCNALVSSSAELEIKGEALVIAPPHLAAQRNFMKNSEQERLELLLRDVKKKALGFEPGKNSSPSHYWRKNGLFAAKAFAAGLTVLFELAHQGEASVKSEANHQLKP